jgi:hypothetical protein
MVQQMSTLVDDLRNTPGQWQAMRYAAADRIEVLERERPCNGMMIADDKGGVLPFCNLKQRIEALEAALADALSGLRYVRRIYPDVTGVGFDRCEAYQSLLSEHTK